MNIQTIDYSTYILKKCHTGLNINLWIDTEDLYKKCVDDCNEKHKPMIWLQVPFDIKSNLPYIKDEWIPMIIPTPNDHHDWAKFLFEEDSTKFNSDDIWDVGMWIDEYSENLYKLANKKINFETFLEWCEDLTYVGGGTLEKEYTGLSVSLRIDEGQTYKKFGYDVPIIKCQSSYEHHRFPLHITIEDEPRILKSPFCLNNYVSQLSDEHTIEIKKWIVKYKKQLLKIACNKTQTISFKDLIKTDYAK